MTVGVGAQEMKSVGGGTPSITRTPTIATSLPRLLVKYVTYVVKQVTLFSRQEMGGCLYRPEHQRNSVWF